MKMTKGSIRVGLSTLLMASGLVAIGAEPLPQADRPLPARFTDPPATARILPILHQFPIDPVEQQKTLQKLERRGFGGFVSNVSFQDYLQKEENWQGFIRGVTAAKAAGMSVWLYDERGYPSGLAGGQTMQGHPEFEARGLLIADATSEGGSVSLRWPPGQRMLAAAFPVREGSLVLSESVDLSAQAKEESLQWQAPPGRWRVMVVSQSTIYEGTHAAVSFCDKLPYINLLMPEPTKRFLEVTHDRYAARLGNDLGRFFTSTFTDEPSLMSLFMRPMPYRVLPWAPNLPVEFHKRRGYALEPFIPALVADAGPRGRRARYDFWNTVGELVSENYFGQIQQWCQRHHVPSGGHLLMEESLTGHVPLYGDFFRCARRLDAPSIDCLTSIPSEVPWYIARLISSVAELEGRTVTMCEVSDHNQRYRPAGDKRPIRLVSFDEIRGTCNRLIFGGINTLTSYYSFQDLSDDQLRQINLWVGRCSTMLTGGHQVADVAVLYPIESIWPRFDPGRHGAGASASAMRVQQVYRSVSDGLYGTGRDFIYVDSRAIRESKVEQGALVHGEQRWRVVVLPQADTMPLSAWEKLARFWHSGGVVVAVGALPENSESEFPCPQVQKLAREMFGAVNEVYVETNAAGGVGVFLPRCSEGLVPLVVRNLLEPDVDAGSGRPPIRTTHRRIDGHEVYLLINDSAEAWEGAVSVAAQGAGELWDPATGVVSPVGADGKTNLRFGSYGAVLLRYPQARSPRRLPAVKGGLPRLALQPLPEVKPTIGKGEFVQAELASAQFEPGRTEWRAAASLTKGQVDTHLFLSFDFAAPVDLSGHEMLVFDSWVAEGQAASCELLAILHDKNGCDYIASVGPTLNAPGRCRSSVMLSQFQIASWSANREHGRVDLSAITAVRVGWGGYLGAEGEKVEFAVAPPQIGRFAK